MANRSMVVNSGHSVTRLAARLHGGGVTANRHKNVDTSITKMNAKIKSQHDSFRRILPGLFILLGVSILLVRSCSLRDYQSGQHPYLYEEGGQKFPFLLYLPDNYQQQDEFPLLVYLHGASLRGHQIEKVKRYGPTRWVENRKDFPFVVLSPQCFPDQDWEDMTWVPGLITTMVKELGLDPRRVYLTGISLGGSGVWDLAAANPQLFAAIAPLCGYGDVADARDLAAIPTWVFHGEKDQIVPLRASTEMVEAIRRAGGEIKLSIIPNAGHAIVRQVYYQNQLYDWFLKQRR